MSPLPLPDHVVSRGDRTSARGLATNTGTAYFVGETEGGPVGPLRATSLDEFVDLAGGRVSTSVLYDCVETYFRVGGKGLYWSRVVSSTATTAAGVMNDGAAAASLRVEAMGPGAYANAWAWRVLTNAQDASIPAGQFVVQVLASNQAGAALIEVTPPVASKAEAIGYANANWRKARLIDQASANPPAAAGPTTFATAGADNRAGIDDAAWQTALDRFPKLLGPGQVAAPGRTTSTAHLQVIAHAVANNRHALLDLPDTSTTATLTASMAAANAAPEKGGRRAQALWPWALVPGLAPFTNRLVPFSAVQAALWAKIDGMGNPNEPAAGEDPQKRPTWLTGLSQPNPTPAVRTTLNDIGVNVALLLPDGVAQYGNRTTRRQQEDPNWLQASGSREFMALEAEADAVLARFVHEQNQKGALAGQLSGELVALCGVHFDRGALYGRTPADAFSVDTSMNTDATAAAGVLRAKIAARVTPGADRVELELVRVSPAEAVS